MLPNLYMIVRLYDGVAVVVVPVVVVPSSPAILRFDSSAKILRQNPQAKSEFFVYSPSQLLCRSDTTLQPHSSFTVLL